MPLGIISPAELEKEIANSNVGTSKKTNIATVVIDPNKGRNGAKEVPEEIRKLIAQEGILGTSNKELATTYKVSESSVSAYKNGANSTNEYEKGNKELKAFTMKTRNKIIAKSKNVLYRSLDNITDERLNRVDARESAAIAKDMSAIIKNMAPVEDKDGGGINLGVQFVFHAPQMKNEADYDVEVLKHED